MKSRSRSCALAVEIARLFMQSLSGDKMIGRFISRTPTKPASDEFYVTKFYFPKSKTDYSVFIRLKMSDPDTITLLSCMIFLTKIVEKEKGFLHTITGQTTNNSLEMIEMLNKEIIKDTDLSNAIKAALS